MEDFGGIIWTLIVVGFGIYGMVMQARKKRVEAEQTHKHGEAWPSWAPEADDEPQQEAAQQQYTPMKPEFEDGMDAEPLHTKQVDIEPSYSNESRYTAISQSIPESNSHNSEDFAQKIKSAKNIEKRLEIEQQTEEESDELKFDLHKAVIYSEILKPKFEE